MRDEVYKYKTFGRRSIVLGGIKLTLLSLIAGRYYFLQMKNSEKYKTLSENNRIKVIIIPALRGHLLDRNGNDIANNTVFYRLGLDAHEIKNLADIIPLAEGVLGRPLKLTKEQIEKRIIKRSKNEPLIIEDSLNWNEVSKVSLNNHLLPGLDIIEAPVRCYPYKDAFAQITGYIGSPTEAEVEELDLPTFNELKIGKSGIEKIFDESLRGFPGLRKTEVDVKGTYIRELSKDPPVSGNKLTLTIDAELQKFVHDVMKERKAEGAVVVLDAKTGGVIAMHSSPSFDPNEFVDGVSKDYWDKITDNPNNPLINQVISTPYPPGSTFKIVTAMAALRSGMSPNRTHTCTGVHYVGSKPFKCWKTGGHGTLNLEQAIQRSCNPYFYSTGQLIGAQAIADTARLLGYGSKSNIELPYEHPGLIPDPKWKQNRYKMEWYMGDTINTSIGQGYVLVTPIQMAVMTARLVTGKKVEPTLVLSDKPKELESLGIAEEHIKIIREGMRKVTNEAGGTAFAHNMSYKDFIVGGKTGTAQVAALKFKHAAHKFMHHGLFTSFGPVDDPKYVVTVIVAHGEAGAKTAAPIAKQIYLKLLGQPTMLDPKEPVETDDVDNVDNPSL